jgi:hypothetical protein
VKFQKLLDKHVDPDFLKAVPEVKALLIKHLDTFVKKEWKGLNYPPLVFKFRDNQPDRLKPHMQKNQRIHRVRTPSYPKYAGHAG